VEKLNTYQYLLEGEMGGGTGTKKAFTKAVHKEQHEQNGLTSMGWLYI